MGDYVHPRNKQNLEIPYNVYCLQTIKNSSSIHILQEGEYFLKGGYMLKQVGYDYMKTKVFSDSESQHVFRKADNCATGSEGVLSYSIWTKNQENNLYEKQEKRLQVMWSTPYNHDHYRNYMAIGISQDRASKQLFQYLYNSKEQYDFLRKPCINYGVTEDIEYIDYDMMIKVRASMTAYHRSELKIEIEELDQNFNFLVAIQTKLQSLIQSQERLITWLIDFEKQVWGQEILVNTVKTLSSIITVAGTALTFTPKAPIGLLLTKIASSGLLITNFGDFIANNFQKNSIFVKLEETQTYIIDLKKISNKIEDLANKIQLINGLDRNEAIQVVLAYFEFGLQTGFQLVQDYCDIKIICAYIKNAAIILQKKNISLLQAFRQVCNIQNVKSMLFLNLTELEIVKESISKMPKKLFLEYLLEDMWFGVIIQIIKTIFSWATVNPNRQNAMEQRKLLQRNNTELVNFYNEIFIQEGE